MRLVTRGLLVTATLLIGAALGSRGMGASTQPSWCAVQNTSAPVTATPTLAGSSYVPESCLPSLVWFNSTRVPVPPQLGLGLAGDARVLAMSQDDQGVITDLVTHRISTVNLPWYRPFQEGTLGTQVTVGAVGNLAVFATSIVLSQGEEGGGSVLGAVDVYDAKGHLVRKFSVHAETPKPTPDVPFVQFSTQTVGDTLYLLYSDGPSGGRDAGIYRITAKGQVTGPWPVPVALTAQPDGSSFLALPSGNLLVTTSGNDQTSEAGRFQVRDGHLEKVWRGVIPGVAPIQGGGSVVVTGEPPPAGASASTVLYRVDWRTGKTVTRLSLPNDQVTPLVAGPFGIIAYGHLREPSPTPSACSAGSPCPIAPSPPAQVLLLNTRGQIVWHAELPLTVRAPYSAPGTELVKIDGRYVLSLGPLDLAVTWGAESDAVDVSGAWPSIFSPIAPTAAAPAVPKPQGVAGYRLFYQGQGITQSHPLVITRANALQSLPLTLSPVNSAGQPVPSPHQVEVTLSDGNAGGTVDEQFDTETVTLAAGQTARPVLYAGLHAGARVIAALPDLSGMSRYTPLLPSIVPANAALPVYTDLADANGVAYPLAPGETVVVLARGPGAGASAVKATPEGDGAFRATVPTGAPGSLATFAVVCEIGGRPVGPASVSVTVTVSDDAPPGLKARRIDGGVVLSVTPPPNGHPIAYAVLRARGTSPAAAGGQPLAIVVPQTYATPGASYVDPVGTATAYTYTAVALYAEGSEGSASPPVTVP